MKSNDVSEALFMKIALRMVIIFFVVNMAGILFSRTAYADESNNTNWGITPFPIIAYTPETNLVFGAFAVLYRKPEQNNLEQKPDTFTLAAYYTLKKQYEVSASNVIHFLDDMFLLRTSFSGSKFPGEYYGIGPSTQKSAVELYTPVRFSSNSSFQMQIVRNLFIGTTVDFEYYKLVKTQDGGVLGGGNVTGAAPTRSVGAGFTGAYDSRDNEMNPHKGSYVEVTTRFYGKYIGSDNSFVKGNIDMRTFFPLGKTTLGFQVFGAASSGTVPFDYLPSLGGGNLSLRGYLNGRYIDKQLIFSQVEYRFPLWRFIGMTVFAGAGEVAPSAGHFWEHPRAAGGLGFRFMLNSEQRINLRADVSYNGTETYCYVNIFEAF